MAKKTERYAELEELAQGICAQHGLGVYDFEVKITQKGRVVVLFLAKASGVTLEDCSVVSRALSEELDERDPFNDKYFLEVSSAGLERKLRYKKHYNTAIGEQVKIGYRDSDGKNASIKGELKEVQPDYIVIATQSGEVRIAFTDIKKARTVYDMKTSGDARKGEV